jgi:hypothetical protein
MSANRLPSLAPIAGTPIVAEIAERLCELEEVKMFAAVDLVMRLGRIAERTPRMFRSVLAALHGDTLAVVESYNVQASKRGLTKQAVHVEWHRDLDRLRDYLPELADMLQDMRDRADNHDIGRQADPLRNGWGSTGVDAEMEAEGEA